MAYTIKTNNKPTAQEGIGLYLDAGWGTSTDYVNAVDDFEKAYQNSFFITAFNQDKLVGMIRYLSDGFHDTQIVECLVLKNFQKQGIANAMLNKLKELYPDSTIYIQTTEAFQDVFIKEGFKKHKLIGMSYFKRG